MEYNAKQPLPQEKIVRRMLDCLRCGYKWFSAHDPVKCPKCKNAYWNRPRKNSRKESKSA